MAIDCLESFKGQHPNLSPVLQLWPHQHQEELSPCDATLDTSIDPAIIVFFHCVFGYESHHLSQILFWQLCCQAQVLLKLHTGI